MHRQRSDVAVSQATVQLDRVQHVGGLGLPVGRPLVVVAMLEVHIIKVHVVALMTTGAEVHDPARSVGNQGWSHQAGQQKMTKVVGAELPLEPVVGRVLRAPHHNGVVDQNVQCFVAVHPSLSKPPDAGQRAEFQLFNPMSSSPVDALMASTVAAAFVRSRAVITTLAPLDASAHAVSAPSPPDAR